MVRRVVAIVVVSLALGGSAHAAMLSTGVLPVRVGQHAWCTVTNVTDKALEGVTMHLVNPNGTEADALTIDVPAGNTRILDHLATEGAPLRCYFGFASGRKGYTKVRAGMLVRDANLNVIGSDTAR